MLNALASLQPTSLSWVKAHVGTPGNERADTLAKHGAEGDTCKINNKTNLAGVKAQIKKAIQIEWTREWTALESCRQTKLWISHAQSKPIKQIRNLSRRQTKTLIEIITGHNNLQYMQHHMDKNESPLCRFCNEDDEMAEHLVQECPVFWTHRRDCFKDEPPDRDNWRPKDILLFSNHPQIDQALHPYNYEND